jgi:MSHA biogenesis protein MshQ
LNSGEYVFEADTLTNYSLELAPGAEVTIFVENDLTLGEAVRINRSGNPNQLLIIVDGRLSATSNSNAANKRIEVNGFVYAAGSISTANNNVFFGSLAAEGIISTGNNTIAAPDEWLDVQRLAGLCDIPLTGDLAVFDNFESYPPGASVVGNNGGSNWGGPWQGVAGQSIIDTSANPLEFVDSEGRIIRSATTLEIVGNNDEIASRPLNETFSGDTLFLSMLVRFTGNPTNNDFVGFWIERPSFGASPQFGLKVNEGGSGTDDFFVRLDQTADYSTEIVPGETYLLVAQYSKGTDNYFSNAKLWVNPECDVSPPSNPSAERNVSPNNRVSDVSTVGFRSENLSGSDAFEIGQVAAGARWQDVVRCSPGPLLEYRMEQTNLSGTAGEILDTSGNSRHGTSFGGLETSIESPAIPGNPGTCLYGDFDGSNDRIIDADAGNYLNGLEAITVMAWVYNTASLSGNDRGIFFTDDPSGGRDNRLGLRYDTQGFFGNGSNVIKASVFTDECDLNQECRQVETVSGQMVQNQWQHIAMTWTTDGEIKVFVNGSQVGTSGTQGTGGTGALAGVERLEVGFGAKGQRWQGGIDEFRIFGVALTEAEIMAEMNRAFPCSGFGPNHIRLTHPGQGLTCSPAEVTVEACANDDCSTLFSDPVEVTFSSPANNWVPNPVTVNGQTDVQLSVTQPNTVTLEASAAPSAQNPTRCFSGSVETCELTFLDSGFVVDVPDHVSGSLVSAKITAVRKDDESERCVPGFSDETKEVSLWSQYSNPSSGTLAVSVDGSALSTSAPGSARSLQFDSVGVADLELRYPDVGRITLNARHEGSGESAGLVMTGNGSFVARPAYFSLDIPGNPAATGVAEGNVFRSAGEPFPVTVSARNVDDDITPNFGRESAPEGVELTPSLVAPVGGFLPPLGGSFRNFGEDCNGDPGPGNNGTACGDFEWPEVGIISLEPSLVSGAYLGTENVLGNAVANVGRFAPADFDMQIVDAGDVEPYCSAANSFAYIGQDLGWSPGSEPLLEVEALAVGGTVTRNYTSGSFLRLDGSGIDRLPSVADELASGTEGALLPVVATLDPMARSVFAPGVMRFTFSGADVVRYLKEPASLVAPFVPDYRITLNGVTDLDGISSTQPALSLQPNFGFDLRYGRIALENAYGPETLPLTVPLFAQFFDGNRFVINADESCWVFNLPGDGDLDFSDSALNDGDTSVSTVVDGQMLAGLVPLGDRLVLSAPGEGKSEAPGNRGIVVEMETPVWLRDFWDDGLPNDLVNPSALATFGVYRGNDRIIYWQEVLN